MGMGILWALGVIVVVVIAMAMVRKANEKRAAAAKPKLHPMVAPPPRQPNVKMDVGNRRQDSSDRESARRRAASVGKPRSKPSPPTRKREHDYESDLDKQLSKPVSRWKPGHISKAEEEVGSDASDSQ